MTGSTRAMLGVVTAVLLCTLTGCAAGDGAGDGSGRSSDSEQNSDQETPCSSASAGGTQDEEPGAVEGTSGTGPGDSQSHTLDPSESCLIESGIASMPEDP
ncbi:hypothetical protein ACFWFF_22175 [Streptomyces sp. NPDC060223]|uniref:hypothetical protein n=1 Tax=unclassified Streptomyces TaxID=2593676 RepID=UPI0036317584